MLTSMSSMLFAQLRVVNSRVGIGDNTPSSKLTVKGGDIEIDASNPDLLFYNDANRLGTIEFTSDVNMWISNEENGPINFETNNQLQMTLTAGGLLGLGTSTPAQDLTILDDNPFIELKSNGGVGYAGLIIDKFNAGDNGYTIYRTDGVSQWYSGLIGNNDFSISRNVVSDGTFYIQRATGEVGIGTTAPAEDLHVEGNMRLEGATPQIDFYNTDGTTKYGHVEGRSSYTEVRALAAGSYLDLDGNTAISFDILNSEKMRLDSDGNLGIGESNPNKKLVVNGQGDIGQSLFVGSDVGAGDAIIELGADRTGDGTAGFDLAATAANGGSFGVRFVRFANGLSQFSHKGTGAFVFNALDNATIFFRTNSVNRFRVNSAGLLPGSDNLYDLGNSILRWNEVWAANGTIQTSDISTKTDVQNSNYGLKEVMQLRPITFYWKDNREYGRKVGLIAQEVEPVISEVVRTKDVVLNENENKVVVNTQRMGLNYAELVPVLVKAIQEQQEKIEELEALEAEMIELKKQLEELYVSQRAMNTNKVQLDNNTPTPFLAQNRPNPFDKETVINYFLPEGTISAEICIMDLRGQLVKSIVLNNSNEGRIVLEAGTLASGIYTYSMIIDGKVFDTKKMVLTK